VRLTPRLTNKYYYKIEDCMKKKYIAPVIMEHKVELNQMICVSGTLDSTESITTRDAVGSRRYDDFWDDEEEY